MEVIGTVSGLIGIATAALQVALAISNLIGNIQDAPQSLRRLDQELTDLSGILEQINEPNLEEIYTSPVEMSLKNCREELDRLQELLRSLAPKSKESGFRQRTWQGFKKLFKEEDIKEAVNSLQSRKLSICLALMTTLTSKEAFHGVKKNRKYGRSDDGDIEINPTQRLLRRASTFRPERQILTSERKEPINVDMNEIALQPSTKLLESVVSQAIERTMKRIQGEYMQEPGTRVEEFLRLNAMEARQLWATDLQTIKDLQAADLERRREDFLQSLPFPDYHGDKIKAKNAQPGTCEWIFDHPQYVAWKGVDFSSVLHSMGKPGSGKTVLSRHVLETLQEAEPGIKSQVLYCFCNNRDNPNQTAPDILGAMVHQFLSDRSSLFPLVSNNHQGIQKLSKTDAFSWSLESLREILLILVESAQLDVVYCIIDALDECEAESVSELLSLISDIVTESRKNHTGGASKIKFFLTSRPFERLEVDLDPGVARIISLTPEIVNRDIEKIVHDGMDKLQKRLRLKKEVKDRLWGILVDRSEGMFLWVLLAMKQLGRARFVTAQKLEKIIQGLPNGLDGIYNQMLEGLEANVIDPDDLTLIRKMITWVVLAQKPLTVSEFRVAMAIELSSDSMDSIELMLHISREIRNLCGSFLEVVSGTEIKKDIPENSKPSEDDDFDDPTATVRLIHQSAKDYFFDRDQRLSSRLSKFRIHEKRGHSEIGSICLTYLLFKDFEKGPYQLNMSTPNDALPGAEGSDDNTTPNPILRKHMEDNPFLSYSTLAWGYHVQNSIESADEENIFSSITMKLTCLFLQQSLHLEHWFQLYRFLKGSEVFHPIKINALHVVCLIDLPDLVGYILNNWSIDINERSGEGETALLFAIQARTDSAISDTLKILLENKPDVNAKDNKGRTALNLASRHADQIPVVNLLLDSQADIEGRDGDRWTALHCAAVNGHQDMVRMLLDRGASIKSKTINGYTPLHLASENGHTNTTMVLLDRGADMEYRTSGGCTVLHLAAFYGYRDTVELLLDRGAELECKLPDINRTPLHLAATMGHRSTVELLLDRGADMEYRAFGGLTALHMAALYGHRDTVEVLLDKGANVENQDREGRTALKSAVFRGNQNVAELLWEKTIAVGSSGDDCWAVLDVAINEHPNLFQSFVEKGMCTLLSLQGNMSLVSEEKRFRYRELLLCAVFNGDTKMVKSLLDSGIGANSTTLRACTALNIAASEGNLEVVNILLRHQADPLGVDLNGWSPIICAWRSSHQDVIERLVEAGSTFPDITQLTTQAPTAWSEVDKSKDLMLSQEDLFVEAPSGDGVSPWRIHSVRANYCMPAEKDIYYYEVEIIDGGSTNEIAVGYSREFSILETLPGWLKGTMGYHGDDGNIYASSGTGSNYSETFTTGDVIGCGVNFNQSTAFYTKNGKYLGTALKDVRGQLYPTLGFSSPGGKVSANFGQKPFVFQDFYKAIISKD